MHREDLIDANNAMVEHRYEADLRPGLSPPKGQGPSRHAKLPDILVAGEPVVQSLETWVVAQGGEFTSLLRYRPHLASGWRVSGSAAPVELDVLDETGRRLLGFSHPPIALVPELEGKSLLSTCRADYAPPLDDCARVRVSVLLSLERKG